MNSFNKNKILCEARRVEILVRENECIYLSPIGATFQSFNQS